MVKKKFTVFVSSTRRRKVLSIGGKDSMSEDSHWTVVASCSSSDSFKRSFKRSGSISRRSSFRTNTNLLNNEATSPSQESDGTSPKDVRTSIHSLNNSLAPNLNGIVDNHFNDSNPLGNPTVPIPLDDDDDDDEDESPMVERIQTVDGLVQDIRVYQVYLLGMSGTGKCSLIRQFKSTEYRGIYDYSSSIGKFQWTSS